MADQFRVIVHGAKQVEAAFADVRVKVDPETGKALRELGKPVQQKAQEFAVQNIPNIGPAWSRMRLGRRRTAVYIVEKQKRGPGGSPRPNLSGLMWTRALQPAVRVTEPLVVAGVRKVIDDLCKKASTV